LVKINKHLKKQIIKCQLYHFEFDKAMREALFIQDVINAKRFHSSEHRIVSQALKARVYERNTDRLVMKLQYFWYVHLRPLSLLSLAVLCTVFSCVAILMEIGSFVEGERFSDILTVNIKTFAEAYMVSFVPLCYMSLCTFYGLFSMKLSYFFALRWNHHTDPSSLLFCGTLLMRLAAPLVYNYLQLQGGKNTSFIYVMGPFRDMSFLGQAVATYSFPLLLCLMSVLTVFGVYKRVLTCMGLSQFLFGSDLSKDTVDEGLLILTAFKKEHNILQEETPVSSKRILHGTEVVKLERSFINDDTDGSFSQSLI